VPPGGIVGWIWGRAGVDYIGSGESAGLDFVGRGLERGTPSVRQRGGRLGRGRGRGLGGGTFARSLWCDFRQILRANRLTLRTFVCSILLCSRRKTSAKSMATS